jgi:hypothetical protein
MKRTEKRWAVADSRARYEQLYLTRQEAYEHRAIMYRPDKLAIVRVTLTWDDGKRRGRREGT